jgi:hypothetical protein
VVFDNATVTHHKEDDIWEITSTNGQTAEATADFVNKYNTLGNRPLNRYSA